MRIAETKRHAKLMIYSECGLPVAAREVSCVCCGAKDNSCTQRQNYCSNDKPLFIINDDDDGYSLPLSNTALNDSIL